MVDWLWFLAQNSVLIFSLIGAVVIAVAIFLKKTKMVMLAFHIILIGFLFDFFAPPYSPCSYSKPEEAYSLAHTFSAWSSETAVCKIYITTFPNVILAEFKFPHPFIYYIAPLLIVLIIIFTSLALKFPRFLATTIYIILFSILTAYLAKDMFIEAFYFTTATIWTFMLFPALLGLLIGITNPFGEKK